MKVRYDNEEVELTKRFIDSLEENMAAMCEMMVEREPEDANCWFYGRCYISDLASNDGMNFIFGSENDMPDDGLGQFAVLRSKQ